MSLSRFFVDSTKHRVRRKTRYRHHDLEDLDTLSRSVFDERRNPKEWEDTQLHLEIYWNQRLGAKVNPKFLRSLKERTMSLAGRMQTFPSTWPGPPKLEMALAGLYYISEDTVCCFMCTVEFKWEHDGPVQCPWRCHKELAPSCAQLKRTLSHGPLPTPDGKRQRRASTSAVDDLLATCQCQ